MKFNKLLWCLALLFAASACFAQMYTVTDSGKLSVKSDGAVGINDSRRRANPPAEAQVVQNYGKLPLSFEVNEGRTDAQVKFLSRGTGYTLFLTGAEAVFAFRRHTASGGTSQVGRSLEPSVVMSATNAVVRMKFVKANPTAKVTGLDELPGMNNYFIGNDPKKWRSSVPMYARVKYEGIYPGIDLVYYGNQRQLEYDFIVAPGSDLRQIGLNIKGTNNIHLDKNGDLILGVDNHEVRLHKPVAYQQQNGEKQEIAACYRMKGKHSVGFAISGYDLSKPLVIDPTLDYSTYVAGSEDEVGSGIAVDNLGNAYITGFTQSIDFPTVNSLITPSELGNYTDAFVAKLNPTGSALVYSTYLGGSWADSGAAIAVDSSGNAYVTGFTQSADFPTVNPLQSYFGGRPGFVAKLNAAGSALLYSTYLGGSLAETPNAIAVDSSRNAYVTGNTQSIDFPTVNAFQASHAGGTLFADAFVTKLNAAGSALVYSTYLGGSGNDWGFGIAVDNSGNAYITGFAETSDFPTMNSLQPNRGGADAFVTKLNPSGSALVYSTFLGGSSYDRGAGIAVDSSGNAYVAGFTSSPDFPTVNPLQSFFGGEYDAFVTKLNPAGTALVYSTYLGGNSGDSANGIAVDSSGNAYVTGYTLSPDFPTKNSLLPFFVASYDTFAAKLNPAGSALVYSSFLGNSSGSGVAIAVDRFGTAYVTGVAHGGGFQTTGGAFQTDPGGRFDAFVLKLSDSSYEALVQQPINADGSSIFKANRGVIPVKFALTENDIPTCALPPATISVTRTAGGTLGAIDENSYSMAADNGSNFRIDSTACQYIYNLAASSLGVGTYRVDISINGTVVGSAVFALK